LGFSLLTVMSCRIATVRVVTDAKRDVRHCQSGRPSGHVGLREVQEVQLCM